MKQIILFALLVVIAANTFAQNCDPAKFRKLETLSRKQVVTDSEFTIVLRLVKNLDRNKCSDYIKKRNGQEYVVAVLTELFGKICLKNNSLNAVKEYVNYVKRHHGSAEEQLSFSFEELFVRQPEYVLSTIGYDEYLLNSLVWGFVNNHYYTSDDQKKVTKNTDGKVKPQLNTTNYKEVFYKTNPGIKDIYPKHKKSIDYLLSQIRLVLKSDSK
ncbi:hypothetical protein [Mucilaginibacter flavidus]|uniref:hypothetical protein n=1 Tax=Mucilaginibacter flavidus TaxID=2949309 RepID=UPI0020924D35|nr:hypothetical protein [Mucilaginibacter flavidus]MCO5945332.1 hypothetical protein [Mucilaginibacter flavidus]